ncbi:MAG TPA: hypothetical protein VMV10_08740 [Pirellulales bacterium]|nr:hypothetical protein [Pirellulales bacterium]
MLSIAWPAIARAATPALERLDPTAEYGDWAPPGVELEFTPLERRLFQAADEGRSDWRWLLAAALAAGGERDESRVERAVCEAEAWGERLQAQLARSGEGARASADISGEGARASADARQRAIAVLEFLHEHVLRGDYRPDASGVSQALAGGGYNCVGATVLFCCLAECCGLPASAAESPGHVFCRVFGASGEIVVETTCRDWFRAANPRDSARRTGPARELSLRGLAALVYYNAGVDLLAKRRFDKALGANLKALRLDPANLAARSNFLAGLNNWALEFNAQRDFAAAVRLLEHGLRIAPDHRPFRVNYVAVHQRWVEALLESDRYELALDRLAMARGKLPEAAYFESAAIDIQRRFAAQLERADR